MDKLLPFLEQKERKVIEEKVKFSNTQIDKLRSLAADIGIDVVVLNRADEILRNDRELLLCEKRKRMVIWSA